MPSSNRAYKKGEPHRDASTFIIVAEGEREDGYFSHFNMKNQRIKIKIVPRDPGKSAPKYFIERFELFKKSEEYSPKEGDTVWFVLDVDRWERESINELKDYCDANSKVYIAISNPCFEVWIHHHFGTVVDNGESCDDLKGQIPSKIRGGYNVTEVCRLFNVAIENARSVDTHPDQFFPNRMQTKVYKLAERMVQVFGPL